MAECGKPNPDPEPEPEPEPTLALRYAIVDAASVGLDLVPENGKEICRLGEMIKVATREQHPVQHPEIDYVGVDILAFRAPPAHGSRANARNTVVMSNGTLDWDKVRQ